MKFILDTRVFLLSISLLDGLAGVRLLRVTIPTYKFRGESAMLECQYELNRTAPPYYGGAGISGGNEFTVAGANNRHRSHTRSRARAHARTRYGNNIKLSNAAHTLVETKSKHRRNKRQYSYHSGRMQTQEQQQEQQQQQHHQQYQQHYQTYAYQPSQSYATSSSSSDIGNSDTNSDVISYQQKQQQKEEEEEQRYPYQTQRSPYGHSVYRGAAFSQALGIPGFSNSGVSSSSSRTHVGASTYTSSGSRGTLAEVSSRRHNFADDDEEDGEEEEEQEEEEEGEALYAIKWYKDNEEFYRFVPKARPQKTSYRFDGIRVSEEHSDSWRVLLRGLAINSSGLYRCEISAEWPNFSSVQGEGHMDVVFLPRDGPFIRGQQTQYQIGDTLSLNCTSGKSHPASRLQWLINDQPVLDESYLIAYNDTVHKHGLITSMLGLELTVDGRHFQDGTMRVKCLASISPALWSGDKESVLQRRRGTIDNREAMLLVHGSAARLHPLSNFRSSLRLLLSVAILTIICQLLLGIELT
ncbi:uncharacterized protein LOC118738527 [Rhagoletis pomonella]|uniref:uncharacterized protein LOC118738527 n=1 Tax=Rhagoletis pomonella TaxID=28610 RepID=UPI001783A6C9|nr:uncharacterized protein LOC118738527 [Rhagoletis pomonella]